MKLVLQFFLLLLLLLASASLRAQVGVGTTTPDSKAALDIQATDKGLLIPRLTQAQRLVISRPPQGLMVYQTDGTPTGGPQTGFWYYAGAGGWVFVEPAAGGSGVVLPYTGSANAVGSVFQVTNLGGGIGVRGASASGQGVVGRVNGTGPGQGVVGAKGTSLPTIEDAGVVGLSEADYGVYARSTQESGVVGLTDGSAAGVAGVRGRATGAGLGVLAESGSGAAVQAASTSGYGVQASSGSTSAVFGSASNNSISNGAVVGTNTNAGNNAVGVLGLTQNGWGVRGVASASNGFGVEGVGTAGYGVRGLSTSGSGIYGRTDAAGGSAADVAGMQGYSSSNTGIGVLGSAGSTGGGTGVLGSTNSGIGVWGVATANGTGVRGQTAGGYAVQGEATGNNGTAVFGVATGNAFGGVYGQARNSAANAVVGEAQGAGRAGYFIKSLSASTANALEVQNNGLGRTGFFSQNNAAGTANALEVQSSGQGNAAYLNLNNSAASASALELQSNAEGYTLQITSLSNYDDNGSIAFRRPGANNQSATITASRISSSGGPRGFLSMACLNADNLLQKGFIMGTAIRNNAPAISGLLLDDWQVSGRLAVTGSLSKPGGSFKIDHPLDPANQYLYHSFVESPDMMNVYNGNVVLDASGAATVALPDYFEALNRDFRYQLTPISAAFTPYVLAEVSGNQFRIAGQPGGKVSWQVTGIRHDKWADTHRIPNAERKEPENQGKYLHPALFGQPESQGIGYELSERTAQAGKPGSGSPAVPSKATTATPTVSRHD
ncbi:hypothetical protein [Hymenobacter norwichensis]|uniref:hypothetical protein n=1 Tax=Hymenobacter norwichensis TaxID=223903 RepID=UPI0003B3A603|nr:hypothetical protein [Hymenobacter norwichensis]